MPRHGDLKFCEYTYDHDDADRTGLWVELNRTRNFSALGEVGVKLKALLGWQDNYFPGLFLTAPAYRTGQTPGTVLERNIRIQPKNIPELVGDDVDTGDIRYTDYVTWPDSHFHFLFTVGPNDTFDVEDDSQWYNRSLLDHELERGDDTVPAHCRQDKLAYEGGNPIYDLFTLRYERLLYNYQVRVEKDSLTEPSVGKTSIAPDHSHAPQTVVFNEGNTNPEPLRSSMSEYHANFFVFISYD